VRGMTEDTKSILLNKEVIAVDQDPLGVQGRRTGKTGDIEFYSRRLNSGDVAMVIVNRSDTSTTFKMPWEDMHLLPGTKVRDLWKHEDIAAGENEPFTIPAHGSLMFRMKRKPE